jgi:hypothetical protein
VGVESLSVLCASSGLRVRPAPWRQQRLEGERRRESEKEREREEEREKESKGRRERQKEREIEGEKEKESEGERERRREGERENCLCKYDHTQNRSNSNVGNHHVCSVFSWKPVARVFSLKSKVHYVNVGTTQ